MNIFIRSIIGISVIASYASAESRIVAKFPANSQIATLQVPAQTSSSTKLIFYAVLKGNSTSQIGVEVSGPKGLQASVDAAQIKGSALATLDKGAFWKIYLSSASTTSGRAANTPAHSTAVTRADVVARATGSTCDALPRSVIDSILANLTQQSGKTVSYEEFCSAAGGIGPNQSTNEGIEIPSGTSITAPDQPKIDLAYGSATGFVQKDSCSKIKDYLVRVTLSATNVPADVLAQGFEVRARFQEVEYTGGKAASLKPVSDGMYAPRPLLLMQSIGGGQWVNMVSWAKGKPRIITKVAASPSIVYYRGFVLVRIIADKLLAGGRGEKVNFELTNGQNVYNICGPRARRRWKVNGYPGG
jgi:hypothetical protein